jgi:hypothetical protein
MDFPSIIIISWSLFLKIDSPFFVVTDSLLFLEITVDLAWPWIPVLNHELASGP